MGGTMSRYMPEETIDEVVTPDLKQDLSSMDSSSFKKKHGKSKIEAHKYVSEARMTAAMKLQKAFQREQEKTASDRKAGEDLLKKPEPVKETEPVVEETVIEESTLEIIAEIPALKTLKKKNERSTEN